MVLMKEKKRNHFLIDLEDLKKEKQKKRLYRIKIYIEKENFKIRRFLKLKDLN